MSSRRTLARHDRIICYTELLPAAWGANDNSCRYVGTNLAALLPRRCCLNDLGHDSARPFSRANKEIAMRLRFTIRDLLWLTLVVALATGWWLDHRRLSWTEIGGSGTIAPFAPIRCFVRPDGTIGNDPAIDPPTESPAPQS